METATIQTLHPEPNKINKKIAKEKYIQIRLVILSILADEELTHTDLMEKLYQNVKDSFKGGVQWYGKTVKLDLEARKLIVRTKDKPQRYKLTK